MKRYKVIKVRQDLYDYLLKTGIKEFGKGHSVPYYLYLILLRFNRERRRR